MKKLSVIGHFGRGRNLLNGQTVKTEIVTGELQNQFGQGQVVCFDTCGGRKTLFKAPFQALSALRRSRNVLIFPAQNGVRVYAPLLRFFSRFFKNRKLHYAVIGGWLPQFLMKRKRLAKALKKFDGIYVETETMKKALEAQGFRNVYLLPNCKNLTVLSEKELVMPAGAPYRLCTFSRVMREKGIGDAADAVISVNRELGYEAFSLDIYGQVDEGQTEWFAKLQQTFPPCIRYGGAVPHDRSVEVLKDYFALLFLTYYEGEGFAGTLIDAFSAGVPVIASDWKYNAEIVNDRVGFVYPTGDGRALTALLKSVASDPATVLDKKRDCLAEAKKYETKKAVQALLEQMDG